ncbi:hypothetical protein CFP56_010122 [Quercus suber]|uniref:Uncharacterized protein n=1 Tax=Quercus suber TaxID=58331 RepID=A0AAW0L2G6_QUESU
MSSSLTCTKLTILTITGVTVQIIGLSLFVYGFFPVKPTLFGVRYSYNPPILSAMQSKQFHTNFEDLYPIILRFHEIDKFRIMIYNAKLEQGVSMLVHLHWKKVSTSNNVAPIVAVFPN